MKTYKNILIYALVNLGDVVLTTAATTLLRLAYPAAKITMMVKSTVAEAVEKSPVIDEVIVFDYRPRENSLAAMWRMAGELRRRKFDLAVSYDRKLRPALLARLAGIPERVGASRVFTDKPSRVTWLYTKTIDIDGDLDRTLQVDTYKKIVRGFTGITGDADPVIAPPRSEDVRAAKKLLGRLSKAKKKIALCVKGTFSLKTWPKEYFAALVRALAKRYDAAFFVVGAPGDRDYSDEVIAGFSPIGAANFCGETSLRSLAALIARADLFVTVDTGAAHIAATTGVPMVVVYGCTSPLRWHPVNKNARVLTTGEPCCPCHVPEDGCPTTPRPACLYGVTAEMVLEACVTLLGK